MNNSREYQQCLRCVMDTSDIDIYFDDKGYCNHCNNFFENISHRIYSKNKSEKELEKIIAQIKKKSKRSKYDCLIGVSGGIDSSYTAYIAKTLGLRALCVHMDNGWNSEAAVKNIKNITNKLKYDYQSYVLDWEEFKDLQLSFLKASVPEAETPTDIAIPAALHRIAAKNKIKYIFSGGNFATEGILPKTWHYNAKDMKYLKTIHKKYGTKKLKKFPTFSYIDEIYFKFIRGIKIIYILNYVPYSKDAAMHLLETELDWKYYGGKHYESKYTGFIQSYILPKKFNIDYRKATFSTQICAGKMTREEALIELNDKPYKNINIELEQEYIAKKLGITINELTDIINSPPKIYRDYPNQENMLEAIYNMYRKLKGHKKS